MRLPSKPVLIRIVVYGSLITFFGWRAYARFSAQGDADEAAQAESGKATTTTETVKLSDGTEMPVLKLTPEQAHEQFGIPLEPDEPSRAVDTPDMGVPETELEPEVEPEPAPEPRIKAKFQPAGEMR